MASKRRKHCHDNIKNGNKDIYLYHLKTKKLERITTNIAIDTEANFSPDGDSIAFTSNRTGQVQIYIKNLNSGKIKRASFEGSYNSKPVFFARWKTTRSCS